MTKPDTSFGIVTMNALISMVSKAAIKNGGLITWEDGLSAIRMDCHVTWKESDSEAFALVLADLLANISKQAVVRPERATYKAMAEMAIAFVRGEYKL